MTKNEMKLRIAYLEDQLEFSQKLQAGYIREIIALATTGKNATKEQREEFINRCQNTNTKQLAKI